MAQGDAAAGFGPSEQVIEAIRERTDTVLLSFSRGKDSIAAYLAIRHRFERVIPFYLYQVPRLAFVEESLAYFERELFDGEHIIRLPHPSLLRQLNNFVFQPPERCAIIEAADFPDVDYRDVNGWLAAELGLDPELAFCATGVRATDSPMRRAHFSQRGAINWTDRLFYPVWDWNKDRIVSAIRDAGVRLPIDYKLFGRSLDGLDLRFLLPMREHLPDDYRRTLEWFPLADLEIFRWECAMRATGQSTTTPTEP